MSSAPSPSASFIPPRWLNLGAIAILLAAIAYLCFWPGPEGLPLVKLGIPERPILLKASVSGISDVDVQTTFKPGQSVEVSLKSSDLMPLNIQSVEVLPTTVAATQPQGTVKPQPDPRPEMGFGSNLLLTLEGKGYATENGFFLGLKRIRVGATVKIHSPQFETSASIVDAAIQATSG